MIRGLGGEVRPLATNRRWGWATVIAMTAILGWQLVVDSTFDVELVVAFVALWLLGLVFALLLGRSGFYAGPGPVLIVVNLLRVHRIPIMEIERLWPPTPYAASSAMVIELRDGGRIRSPFTPGTRSAARKAVYTFAGQHFVEEPARPLLSARAARGTIIAGSMVAAYLFVMAGLAAANGEGWLPLMATTALFAGLLGFIWIGTHMKW